MSTLLLAHVELKQFAYSIIFPMILLDEKLVKRYFLLLRFYTFF